MFVDVTFQLVKDILGLFCEEMGLVPTKKEVKKILAAIEETPEVKKYFFCGAVCISSKRICMKEVPEGGGAMPPPQPQVQVQGVY